MTDQQGRRVLGQEVTLEASTQVIGLPVGRLQPGLYILQASLATRRGWLKVIKR